MKPIFRRGPSLKFRFVLAILISFFFIFADVNLNAFSKIRKYIDTIISPLYFILSIPNNLFNKFFQIISLSKEAENQVLRQELLLKKSELLILDYYKQENIRLRELLGSPLQENEYKMVTKVISVVNNPYIDQIIIDKGSINGVYDGQPVVNDKGIVGQVISVAKTTSRVLLVCDITHALPIQVLRNNIRVIASGNGCTNDLQLDYLPLDTDILVGDILVTSGLGGRFPEGYPVAIVSSVNLNIHSSYAVIHARPIINLRNLNYALLWWSKKNNSKLRTSEEIRKIANDRLTKKPQLEIHLNKP